MTLSNIAKAVASAVWVGRALAITYFVKVSVITSINLLFETSHLLDCSVKSQFILSKTPVTPMNCRGMRNPCSWFRFLADLARFHNFFTSEYMLAQKNVLLFDPRFVKS